MQRRRAKREPLNRGETAMGLRLWAVLLLCLLGVTLPSSARADPVLLTDGALVGDDFGRVTLNATGQRGLSITAFGDSVGGSYGPSRCFPCLTGDLLTIASVWSDSDFPGSPPSTGKHSASGRTPSLVDRCSPVLTDRACPYHSSLARRSCRSAPRSHSRGSSFSRPATLPRESHSVALAPQPYSWRGRPCLTAGITRAPGTNSQRCRNPRP